MKGGKKEEPKKGDPVKGGQKTADAAPEAEEVKEVQQPGFGKFEYMNQTIYEGNWKLEKGKKVKHGHGKITYPGAQGKDFGQEEYEGEWALDRMHGQGKYIYTSGAEYKGHWHEGKMHGQG